MNLSCGNWLIVWAESGALLVRMISASQARSTVCATGVRWKGVNSPNLATSSQGLSPGFRVYPSIAIIFINLKGAPPRRMNVTHESPHFQSSIVQRHIEQRNGGRTLYRACSARYTGGDAAARRSYPKRSCTYH